MLVFYLTYVGAGHKMHIESSYYVHSEQNITPAELTYIRSQILEVSQRELAKMMCYNSASAISAMEKQGAKVPNYFEHHLKLLVKDQGKLWLIPSE